jgi:hypothetical protein
MENSTIIEKRKKNTKIFKIFLIPIAILGLILIVGTIAQGETPKTKAEIEQIKNDSITQAREKRINLALMGLEKMAQDKMRDPGSYENIEKTFDKKDTLTVVKLLLKFRGNNAFGGKSITTVLANYNVKEDYLDITNQFNE